jgi:hypothetical protein
MATAASKSSSGRAGLRTSWPPTHSKSWNYTGLTFSAHGPFGPRPSV